jgi:hypothetical protein
VSARCVNPGAFHREVRTRAERRADHERRAGVPEHDARALHQRGLRLARLELRVALGQRRRARSALLARALLRGHRANLPPALLLLFFSSGVAFRRRGFSLRLTERRLLLLPSLLLRRSGSELGVSFPLRLSVAARAIGSRSLLLGDARLRRQSLLLLESRQRVAPRRVSPRLLVPARSLSLQSSLLRTTSPLDTQELRLHGAQLRDAFRFGERVA